MRCAQCLDILRSYRRRDQRQTGSLVNAAVQILVDVVIGFTHAAQVERTVADRTGTGCSPAVGIGFPHTVQFVRTGAFGHFRQDRLIVRPVYTERPKDVRSLDDIHTQFEFETARTQLGRVRSDRRLTGSGIVRRRIPDHIGGIGLVPVQSTVETVPQTEIQTYVNGLFLLPGQSGSRTTLRDLPTVGFKTARGAVTR